jgi:hypothetical protein
VNVGAKRLALLPAWLLALGLGATVPGQIRSGAVVPGASVPGFPAGFVENAGQWPPDVTYEAKCGSVLFRAETGGFALQHEIVSEDGHRRGTLVRFSFTGKGSTSIPTPAGAALPGMLHFLLGNDPTSHRRNVRRWNSLDYGMVAPGVSASLMLGPSSPVLRIRMDSGGASETLRIDVAGAPIISADGPEGGAVHFATSAGNLSLRIVNGGHRTPMFHSDDGSSVHVQGTGADCQEGVTADLQLEWSTYIGGSEGEFAGPVDLDAQERVVVGGYTYSLDFPTTPGAFDNTFNGGSGSPVTDAFVSCLEADGSGLVFSTYLGGSGNDYAGAVAVEDSGSILVGGITHSTNFPTTPGAWKSQSVSSDAFLARLSADGSALEASTYLGGSGSEDGVSGLAVLSPGAIAACAGTDSADFPVTPNALDTSASDDDGTLTVFDPTLARVEYSTLFGGPWDDLVRGLALRPDGTLALCGRTFGPAGFPVTPGALDTVPPALGSAKGFVIVIDPTTGALVYGTFVPGSPLDIAAHPDGSVTVLGDTTASGLATQGAYDTTYAGSGDGLLFRLSADGSSLHYATYLGGSSIENMGSLVLDSAGRPTVVGSSYSSSYPVTPGALFTPKTTSNLDIIVSRLEADGSRLIYSTHLGGDDVAGSDDGGSGLELTSTGAIVVTGFSSGGFPVSAGAWDPDEPATFDSVIFKLTMLPTGAVAYGAGTPAAPSGPPPYISVDTWPSQSDSSSFAVTCLSAPPDNTQGLLLVSLAGLQSPLPFKGGALWLDPAGLFLFIPATSDSLGFSRLPVTIPAAPPLNGVVTHWQYLWKPIGGGVPWPMSNALELTIQP